MPGDLTSSNEARLRAAVEYSPSGLLMSDHHGTIVLVNREVERLFGYPREELLGQSVETLIPEAQRQGHARSRTHYDRHPSLRGMGVGRDLTGVRKDGTVIPVEIGLTPVETSNGTFVLAAIVDISERKAAEATRRELEARLRHAHKLEAVGTLAGGIAHDFNNILTVILSYLGMLRHAVDDPGAMEDLLEVERASMRGRDLVHRILSFARRSEPDLQPLDVAALVQEAARPLRATLPPSVELQVSVASGTPPIRGDRTALHEVIHNLVNNGAQAMPQGGLVHIDVAPLTVSQSVGAARSALRAGLYVQLAVRDTGTGMDPQTRDRAFEPFFTTKKAGHGTGLGLAMVHSIVQDHDGDCILESAKDQGTCVRCLFPAFLDGLMPPPEEAAAKSA